jgi:serine/threonine-protein kinase
MLGQTLGRYRLVEQLGKGGVGIVYRAEDPRLDRDVAIKVLNESGLADERALQRFKQEARALSRLMHPNIATLFDFDSDRGVDFLVLEYVPGETLARTLEDGPLPEPRARTIALEIAGALEAAHEQGIVHRDLKPGNVIITPRGRAKVLDFGLARLLSDGAHGARATALTQSGALVGTVRYMAPEQVAGGDEAEAPAIDARTDIHALGLLLYEMTTAQSPWSASNFAALLFQIAHGAPRPLREARPGTSAAIEAVVMRCLEKEPERRFASADALARALRESELAAAASGDRVDTVPVSSPGRTRRIQSVAVLPLENRSGDPEQEFFADGMTDTLITDLAQIGALRVISRTSSMRFKGTRKTMPEIARELNVDAVVEGSVLRSGARVRITAQLVDAVNDASLWARSYEGDISDILSLQREVARAIADGVRVQVTPEEETRLASRRRVNPAAHVAYLRGRFMWNRWDAKSLRESIVCYEEALTADPDYALAWAGLADSYSILGNTNAMPPAEAYPKARTAAERGLSIDDTVAELHASLAYVRRFYDWDWRGAEREFLRALALNPGYATARRWYAQFLSGLGRHDEALIEARRALELDPLSLIIHSAVGDVFFYARRYEESAAYCRRSLEMDPTFEPGHTDLARALEHMGRCDDALREFRSTVPVIDGRPKPSPGLAIFLLRAGHRDAAAKMIAELLDVVGRQFVSPWGIASYFAVAGESDSALEWLDRAHGQRDGALVWLKVHPRLDGLREEPKFRDLLRRMNLES